jgi:hypothetical protein
MHDAAHIAAGGKKASQSQEHAWFVLDRNYCGPLTISPVSVQRPNEIMPWQHDTACETCGRIYPRQRRSSRFCSATCRQRAHRNKVGVTVSVTAETKW